MLTTLKIELLETSKEQLSMNLIVCKNNLMGAEDSDAGSLGASIQVLDTGRS